MAENSSEDERTMWVGNLHSKVSEELLWELFLQAGPLESVKIPKDYKTGRQKNFAFVRFQHKVSVDYVIALMNGLQLFQTPLKLSVKNTPSANGTGPDSNERRGTNQRHRFDERNEENHRARGPELDPDPNVPHHSDSMWNPMPGHQMMQCPPHLMPRPPWSQTTPDVHGYDACMEGGPYRDPMWHANGEYGNHREDSPYGDSNWNPNGKHDGHRGDDSYGDPKWHADGEHDDHWEGSSHGDRKWRTKAESRSRSHRHRDELVMRRTRCTPNDAYKDYDRRREPYHRHERERRHR